MPVPAEIHDQKYISLTTFRKNGMPVQTPLWFAESNGKLYFMTRNDSWKYKRIRNNPSVSVAPCTMRGKVTGPDFVATARILPPQEWSEARKAIRRKYWACTAPFLEQQKRVFGDRNTRLKPVPKSICYCGIFHVKNAPLICPVRSALITSSVSPTSHFCAVIHLIRRLHGNQSRH